MAIRPILLFPHPNLRKISTPIKDFSSAVKQLADDLIETMYEAKGVGLSAPQINVAQRMVVCDVSGDRNKPVVLINPVITEASDLQTQEEGCLSFPGFYEKVKRGQHITVTAQDTTGKEFSLTADGLEAICIQHECDHLDGKLFVDYLSKLRSSRIRKKMLRAD